MMLRYAAILLLVGACASSQPPDRGQQESAAVHDVTALDYEHEAAMYRDKAAALLERAAIYERIFGAQSDWVTGTRMLAAFYEEEARDRERQAGRNKEY